MLLNVNVIIHIIVMVYYWILRMKEDVQLLIKECLVK